MVVILADKNDIELLLHDLVRLARKGGQIALQYHGKTHEIVHKTDNSPLTEADLAVDASICRSLGERYPDMAIVTEERAESHVEVRDQRYFLVDPIDGTREFIADRGEFTVNICLIEAGIPIAGVVCAPAVGRVFAGANGIVPFETDMEGRNRKPLAPRLADNDALVIVASRSHLDADTATFIERNRVAATIRGGSSLKFCKLAAGEADIYPRFGPTMEWDTAAGHAILLAAGGQVEEISGAALKYGKPAYRNGPFIAYTAGTQFVVPEDLREL